MSAIASVTIVERVGLLGLWMRGPVSSPMVVPVRCLRAVNTVESSRASATIGGTIPWSRRPRSRHRPSFPPRGAERIWLCLHLSRAAAVDLARRTAACASKVLRNCELELGADVSSAPPNESSGADSRLITSSGIQTRKGGDGNSCLRSMYGRTLSGALRFESRPFLPWPTSTQSCGLVPSDPIATS